MPVRGRYRDDNRDLADLAAAGPMRNRDLAEVMALHRGIGDLGHDLLGHAGVSLVLERDHLPAARLPAHGSLEGRDRAGAIVRDLRGHGGQVDRPVHEPERAAGTGGMIATPSPPRRRRAVGALPG